MVRRFRSLFIVSGGLCFVLLKRLTEERFRGGRVAFGKRSLCLRQLVLRQHSLELR